MKLFFTILCFASLAQADVLKMSGKEMLKYVYDNLEKPRTGKTWDGRSPLKMLHQSGRSGGITSNTGGYGWLIAKMTNKCNVEVNYKGGDQAEMAVYDTGWVGEEQVRFTFALNEVIEYKNDGEMFLPKGTYLRVKLWDGVNLGNFNIETNGTKEYMFAAFKRLPGAEFDQKTYGFVCNF